MNSIPSRQLLVFCDGTNNTLTGGKNDTNVLQLYRHVVNNPPTSAETERVLYYDPGVGSPTEVPPVDFMDWFRQRWERISGLASGSGVFENVGQAYLFLMRNWRSDNDRIYIFGFSRGAFTARAVAGMVNLFGVLRPEHEALLPTLLHIYFSQTEKAGSLKQKLIRGVHQRLMTSTSGSACGARQRSRTKASTRESLAQEVRDLFAGEGADAWVHWVGVWDTVESVGLPGILSKRIPSSATVHGKRVRNVRHALSLDEHRWPFLPRLYDEVANFADGRQSLKQLWFSGCHCDVGGSYPTEESALSDTALEWMIEEVKADLKIPSLRKEAAECVMHDPLWETPWWALAGMTVREVTPSLPSPDVPEARVSMVAVAGPIPVAGADTVWSKHRPIWPVVAAVAFGLISLVLSGLCLLQDSMRSIDVDAASDAVAAARMFAGQQLASLWGAGLLTPGKEPWNWHAQPAWAMCWDLAFIACWGYVLARVSSRAFAWVAGERNVTSLLPKWRWIGMAPMIAVLGDASEDLLTLLGLAAHGAGTDIVAKILLWSASLGSVAKLVGLIACIPLVLLRLRIAFGLGVRRP